MRTFDGAAMMQGQLLSKTFVSDLPFECPLAH